MEPRILFENIDLVVLDKPYGMVVNRADTTRHMVTLQDWIEEHIQFTIPDIGNKLETDFVKRAGIVHRIDKETSGALIVAKNEDAFTSLQSQFKEKKVHKTYIALCHGRVAPEHGTINAPVGRLPWNRKKFGVYADGRESITEYEVEKYYDFNGAILSLVKCYPQTGRTHQIRVHMRYLGFPIFADPLYAGRKNARDDRKYLERHFLHAASITFHNPHSMEETITVDSPLPVELVDFLAQLHVN